MSIQEISASELLDLIKKEPIKLVDVRTPGEFRSTHIPNSLNLPLSSSDFESFKNSASGAEKIVLICQSGARAKAASNELMLKNIAPLFILSGGMNSWQQSGFDVIKGEGTISMERQVRIAAGLFVFLGSILSLIFSLNFIFIPIFIGAGLVFSGVTNTCGMARMLAVLPWNNPKSKSTTSCDSIKDKCC
jgi:rhodanese-related sulfurtransferase